MVTSAAVWVGPPASYTQGRVRPVQFVVVHATAGSEGPNSAEAGAAYDKRRTDGTSTHLFVDSDTALREVRDQDRAHHARYHGNEIGIGVELCGQANQTDSQWHDAASLPTLRLAAREVAALCQAHGLPPRRLSVAEVRAAYFAADGQRPRGICGHADVTQAYPEDHGTHWDPGPGFPWTEFVAMVADELTGGDMSAQAEQQIAEIHSLLTTGKRLGPNQTADGGVPIADEQRQFYDIDAALVAIASAVATVVTELAALRADVQAGRTVAAWPLSGTFTGTVSAAAPPELADPPA